MAKYYPDVYTERKLNQLEKNIAEMYGEASKEMANTANAYFAKFKERYIEEYNAYQQGKYTKEEFTAWYQTQIQRGKGYKVMADKLADRATNADLVAQSLINDATPSIFSLNANYEAYKVNQAYSNLDFQLYDEQTARRLMAQQNHIEFKTVNVNPIRDYVWNRKEIHKALTSGILQGLSPEHLAQSYLKVMKRDEVSARRNARTSFTSAQNAGRIETYYRADKLGIKLEKEWISTHDSRTRDSHGDLDGERVPYDKEFSNGLMHPADKDGAPAEVYNCRCTVRAILPDINDEKRKTYKEWYAEQEKKQKNSYIETKNATKFTESKPTRPKKTDYKTEEEYYRARENYKAQKEEYEKLKAEWIASNTPQTMTIEQITNWCRVNEVYIYNTIDGADTRVIRAFTERYETLIRDYPEVKDTAKKIYYNGMVNISYTGDSSYLMEASGGFNFGKKASDFVSLADTKIDQIAEGYTVEGAGGVNSLFDHEFGHNLYTALKYRNGMSTHDRVMMETDLLTNVAGRAGFSEYSNTNDHELFAEGFSAWYGGESTEFAKAFGEFLKRWR